MGMIRSGFTALGALAIAASAWAQHQPDPAQVAAGQEKAQICAACHGPEGKGNGPAAAALKKAPADLTELSSHNNGKFPDVRVSRYIEGVDTVQAHGTRDMPVWGDVFKSLNRDPAASTMRVSNLTEYVKSLQAK